MQSDRSEQKTEISPFDMICDAALANDPDLLDNALQSVCIDVWQESDYGTPVTRVAYEGNVAAVKFLLERGASPANAACGYARGDHMKELYELLSQVKKQNPNKLTAVLKQATYGVALNQDAAKLDAFWKTIEAEYPDHIPFLFGSLARAHAQRGNMNELGNLWKSITNLRTNKELAIETMSGLALSGNVDKINSLYDLHHYEIEEDNFFYEKIIVTHLARGGHKDKVEFLKCDPYRSDELIMEGLAQNGFDENTGVGESEKAEGFAVGGYKAKAFEYAKKNPSETMNCKIAKRLADAGHLDAALDFLKINPGLEYVETIAFALYCMKDVNDANVFLEKMKKDKNITPQQVTQFIIIFASHFFSDGKLSKAFYFFEKEPTEEVLSGMLSESEFNRDAWGTTEVLKIILMRHESSAKKILKYYLAYCTNSQEAPDLSFLACAAISYPEIFKSNAELLEKSDCDRRALDSVIKQANDNIVRLGFTTMSQLIAWRDPVIRYLLISNYFREKITHTVIENIISFLSPIPTASRNMAKGKDSAFFFKNRYRPAVPAPEESKIIISGITQDELKKALDGYKPSGIFGTTREIAALTRLASDPRFKGVLIHHSVIASTLSPYPARQALFTNEAAQAGSSNTDRIIVLIRELYGSKELAENKKSDPTPGPKRN